MKRITVFAVLTLLLLTAWDGGRQHWGRLPWGRSEGTAQFSAASLGITRWWKAGQLWVDVGDSTIDTWSDKLTGLTFDAPATNNRPGLVSSPNPVLWFGGVDDYFTIPGATAEMSPGAGDFSAFMWFKTTTDAGLAYVGGFGKWRRDNKREWMLFTSTSYNSDGVNGANKPAVIMSDDGTAVAGHTIAYRLINATNDGVWHLFGCTWISDVLQIYLDGVELTVAGGTLKKELNPAITSIYNGVAIPSLGCDFQDATTPQRFYTGYIGGQYYAASGLTAAQVLELYNETKGYYGL